MTNKKVKNATQFQYNGIQFKSKLEVMAYKTLLENGFNPLYEPQKIIIWKGCRPTVPFFNKDKDTGLLKSDSKKLIDITYTPDFVMEYNNLLIFIEIKGFENDVFYIKKKLFRSWLEELKKEGKVPLYFEIYSKKQLLQAIEIIRNYDKDRTNKSNDKQSS